MTDTAGLRRHNLRQWIEKYYGGLQTRFAEAVALNTGELSALLKNKSFGEKKARKIEQAAKMPVKSNRRQKCPPFGSIPNTPPARPNTQENTPCPISPPSPKS
ncbi:TPA: hypothetical protein ACXYL1_002068 [Neisseria meningitidis]